MMLLRSMEKSVKEVLDLLEEYESAETLNVFYVESRAEMESLIGRPVTGFSAWGVNTIFLVVNSDWRSFEKHEFTHIVTMGRWGYPDPGSSWMIEGISIYCDGWCREFTVDQIAFKLVSEDQLPPLQVLFEKYSELGEIKAGFYAGSFIGYIHEKFGMAAVRKIWLNGTENLESLLGEKIDQIEKSWKTYLKEKVSPEIKVDLKTINELGCG
jgi:hypothetical protein